MGIVLSISARGLAKNSSEVEVAIISDTREDNFEANSIIMTDTVADFPILTGPMSQFTSLIAQNTNQDLVSVHQGNENTQEKRALRVIHFTDRHIRLIRENGALNEIVSESVILNSERVHPENQTTLGILTDGMLIMVLHHSRFDAFREKRIIEKRKSKVARRNWISPPSPKTHLEIKNVRSVILLLLMFINNNN